MNWVKKIIYENKMLEMTPLFPFTAAMSNDFAKTSI